MTLEDLVARIRAEFPDLAFRDARLANGDDNWVVILDDAWAFRFPRSPEQARWFPVERAVLSALHDRTTVPVPYIERLAADHSFGGYRLVPGEPLTPQAFAGMPRPAMERLIDAVAPLICALHDLPHAVAVLPDGETRTASGQPAWFAANYRHTRRPQLAAYADTALLARLDRLFELYPTRPWVQTAVIHGDFSEDHILVGPDGVTLTGVIDFGDTCLGDPAYDLTLFWSAGDWAAQRAVRACGGDADMLARSLWSCTRYSADRLYWALEGDERYDIEACRNELQRRLSALSL